MADPVSLTASILSQAGGIFSKMFGGGKSAADKAAASQARREGRAQSILASMSGVTAALPPDMQNTLGQWIEDFTTGRRGYDAIAADIVQNFPTEIVNAIKAVSSSVMGKKRAAGAFDQFKSNLTQAQGQFVPPLALDQFGRLQQTDILGRLFGQSAPLGSVVGSLDILKAKGRNIFDQLLSQGEGALIDLIGATPFGQRVQAQVVASKTSQILSNPITWLVGAVAVILLFSLFFRVRRA